MTRQPDELFDKAKIKKYCADVKITDDQINAAKEWLELLNNNKLEKEDQNRSIFEQVILQKILGFSVYDYVPEKDNIDYTISNRESSKSLCIEVKGTSTKDLSAYQSRGKKDMESPIKQTWSYMGLGFDFGLCTNYKEFWLLYRNVGIRKIYKFIFPSIQGIKNTLDEEKLKEFVGIFSKQRIFDEDIITKLTQESVLAEQEFTDEFYKLYHETRLMLIEEFSSLPNVKRDEAIHWAQIFLNRVIFVFFVEDHNFIPSKIFHKRIIDILKSSSISEYTHLISDNIDDLFKIMNSGSKIHAITGFNGGLFEKQIPAEIFFPDLRDSKFFRDEIKQNSKLSKKSLAIDIDVTLSSRYAEILNPIVKNLLIMDSYDFTSDLNVNILGHIFEQSISDLEELHQQITSKRKREGVYYTPEYVTDYICRNTLISYLSQSNVNTVSDLVTEYSTNILSLENKIKEIKIVDPACGSGAFLIKTVDILLEIYNEIQKLKPQIPDQTQLKNWSVESEISKIIEANIYGVDINEQSVEITQLGLFLKLAGPNRKLISLSKNIKMGSSLIEDKSVDQKAFDWKQAFPEVMHEKYGGFDVFIGNPPYVFGGNVGITDVEKSYFKEKFISATRKLNLFSLFVEQGINLLKNGGILGFIVPNTLLRVTSYEDIRKLILEQTKILQIINLESGVFRDAVTSSIIIVIQKENNKKEIEKHQVKIFDGIQKSFKLKPQADFDNELHIFDLGTIGTDNTLVTKMDSGCTLLGSMCKEMIFGVVITKNRDEVVADTRINKNYKKFLEGRDINRYTIKFDNKYLLYDKTKLHRSRTPEIFEAEEKILVQRISGGKKPLKAAYDDEKFYDKESINNIILNDKNIHAKYILALLNSHLMNWYYSMKFTNASDLTVNVSKAYLSQLPIKKISLKEQQPIVELADKMIFLNKKLNEIDDKKTMEYDKIQEEMEKADSKIDDLIYNLYGLTDLEKKNIEKYME